MPADISEHGQLLPQILHAHYNETSSEYWCTYGIARPMDERAGSVVRVAIRKVRVGLPGSQYSKALRKRLSIQPIRVLTWANFTRDKDQKNAPLNGTGAVTQKKLQADHNLLAAQQQLSLHPNRAPYNMWVSYYNEHVAVHGSVDILSRPAIYCLEIASILNTAPHHIGVHFREAKIALSDSSTVILRDLRQLRNIRLNIANFRHFPVLAEARARIFRILQTDKMLQAVHSAEKDDTPGDSTRFRGLEQNDQNDLVSAPYLSMTYSRRDSLRRAFEASPGSWAIEPLYRGLSAMSPRTRWTLRKVAARERQFVRTTSRKKWNEIVVVMRAAEGCADAIMGLASELSFLQYYAAQHYPQLFTPRRATLGREYFESLKGYGLNWDDTKVVSYDRNSQEEVYTGQMEGQKEHEEHEEQEEKEDSDFRPNHDGAIDHIRFPHQQMAVFETTPPRATTPQDIHTRPIL